MVNINNRVQNEAFATMDLKIFFGICGLSHAHHTNSLDSDNHPLNVNASTKTPRMLNFT